LQVDETYFQKEQKGRFEGNVTKIPQELQPTRFVCWRICVYIK